MDTQTSTPTATPSTAVRHGGQGSRPRWVAAAAAMAAGLLLVASGCAVEPADPVALAQADVAAKEKALTAAETAATANAAAFCSASADYITALDRYGDILVQTSPTVGDVRAGGKDLTEPREDTMAAGTAAISAQEAVVQAEQDLAAAQAALAVAQAEAAGETPPSPSAQPTQEAPAPPASVARVRQAEQDFAATQAGITDRTPLRQAAEQFNAAAVALQMAWLQLFADAGCMTDEQKERATDTVREYTKTLQQALAELGHYQGEVDGVYGPQTVEAVQALQKAHGLPETGAVDRATEAAIRADLATMGSATVLEETATTAALQQTLMLAGYWDGPIDGVWTDELTDALKELQSDLGVPATGKVDAATIAAFEQALEDSKVPPTPTATATATATATVTATTTATATATVTKKPSPEPTSESTEKSPTAEPSEPEKG